MDYFITSTDENEVNWKLLNYEFFENFSSPHTKKCYERDIGSFFKFLTDNNVEMKAVHNISRAHVIGFRNYLLSLSQAPKTICRKLSSLSSYFDFLLEKNLLEINPCNGVKRPAQVVIKETNDLSDQSVENLFNCLFSLEKETLALKMHRAVIFLLFSTGIRKSELTHLKYKDYFQIDDEHFAIRVKAKGGKYLTKVIHESAKIVLDEYLEASCSEHEVINEDDFLIRPTKNPHEPTNLNHPLNPKTVDYIVKKYCKLAGIKDRISPHSARATYIGSALENGVELWRVSKDVGHQSTRTTEIYNKRRLSTEHSPVHHLGFFQKGKKAA